MTRHMRLTVMIALLVSCAVMSVVGLIALRAGGQVSLGPVVLLQVAAGYDRAADKLLEPDSPSPRALRKADALSRAAIAQFPYDTRAWARLAYVDRLQHGYLTPAGLGALQRSYDLVGIDPDIGVWRIRFALENSQTIPRTLRTSVREEVTALWTSSEDRPRIVNLQNEIQNPAGRLSLALWVNQLQAAAAK